jgi:hypothetical protein
LPSSPDRREVDEMSEILAALAGFIIGAAWMWRIWDRAMREFEGDGEHDGSPWYRIARKRP